MITLYLGLLPSFAMQIRCSSETPVPDGAWLVLIFIAVTKASDIGGYLIGSTIGRHKLLPAVSPGKSIEGTIGGVLTSVLTAVFLRKLYYLLPQIITSQGATIGPLGDIISGFHSLQLWQVIVFGVLMAISGLMGDLFESILKRAARQKDSSSMVPSYGGVLDLIDSPVMAAPVAWFVLTVWWEI